MCGPGSRYWRGLLTLGPALIIAGGIPSPRAGAASDEQRKSGETGGQREPQQSRTEEAAPNRLTTQHASTEAGPPTAGPEGVARAAEITPQRTDAITRRATTTGIAITAEGEENRSPGSLEEEIAAASAPLDKAQACLAAARHKLANQCAPLLLAICAGAFDAEQAEKLGQCAAEGLAYLDRASAVRSRLADQAEGDILIRLEDRTDMLRAFGAMFSALARDPSSEAPRMHVLNACNGLAVYLDDDNAKLAESAKLWLGIAYRLAGRPERSLQVLGPTLTMPAEPRIGLLARLQRCLALGDRGDYVAGIALCLRLGVRVEAWFADEHWATRKQAADTVRFTRIELLRGWAAELRAQGQDEQAEAVAHQADELIGSEPYPPSADRRLRLTEAIAGLPGWGSVSRHTTTRDAPSPIDPDED
jgi:hypothetical protein